MQESTPIPDNLQGVSWKVGDYAQTTIDTTEEYLQLYSKTLTCENKQNAVRYGTEQNTDLRKTFKIIPPQQKSM